MGTKYLRRVLNSPEWQLEAAKEAYFAFQNAPNSYCELINEKGMTLRAGVPKKRASYPFATIESRKGLRSATLEVFFTAPAFAIHGVRKKDRVSFHRENGFIFKSSVRNPEIERSFVGRFVLLQQKAWASMQLWLLREDAFNAGLGLKGIIPAFKVFTWREQFKEDGTLSEVDFKKLSVDDCLEWIAFCRGVIYGTRHMRELAEEQKADEGTRKVKFL